jgi:hypothetical protein
VHGEKVVGRANTLQPFDERVVIKRTDILVVLEHGAGVAIVEWRNSILYVHFDDDREKWILRSGE